MDKRRLRQLLLARRDHLEEKFRTDASHAISLQLLCLSEFVQSEKILFYMAFRNEVDVQLAIDRAWGQGKEVLIPRTNSTERSLTLHAIQPDTPLVIGAYGIREPIGSDGQAVPIEKVDLVVCPGVAFDREGYRLGYGGGYYDRLLEQNPEMIKVGVAYQKQIVETVYPEGHDQRMDKVITPDGTIDVQRGGASR